MKKSDSPIDSNENWKNENLPKEGEGAQCQFQGQTYSDGAVICINDRDHKCRDGRWRALGTRTSC